MGFDAVIELMVDRPDRQIALQLLEGLLNLRQLDVITPTETYPLTLDEFRNAATGEVIEVAHAGQGFCIKLHAPEGNIEEGFVVRKHLRAEDLVKNRVKEA